MTDDCPTSPYLSHVGRWLTFDSFKYFLATAFFAELSTPIQHLANNIRAVLNVLWPELAHHLRVQSRRHLYQPNNIESSNDGEFQMIECRVCAVCPCLERHARHCRASMNPCLQRSLHSRIPTLLGQYSSKPSRLFAKGKQQTQLRQSRQLYYHPPDHVHTH